jgi:hypothetical protein
MSDNGTKSPVMRLPLPLPSLPPPPPSPLPPPFSMVTILAKVLETESVVLIEVHAMEEFAQLLFQI